MWFAIFFSGLGKSMKKKDVLFENASSGNKGEKTVSLLRLCTIQLNDLPYFTFMKQTARKDGSS